MLEYLEQQVFSRVKNQFSPSIKENFPKLEFTTDSKRTNNIANFPLVFMFSLTSPETSKDLERTRINGVTATFQIEVSDNESQSRARTVMTEVIRVMKTMRFDVLTMPIPADYGGVYRLVARFRRSIDETDIL